MSNQFVPLDLPTEGRVYPVSQIEARAFTTEEVKRLQPLMKKNDINRLFSLVNECIRGIDSRDLTTGDWWYFLAWLRLNTFPHIPLQRHWVCPEKGCGAQNVAVVSLSGLKIVTLPQEFKEPAYLTLEHTDVAVPLKLRRVGAAIKAEEYLEKLYGRAPKDEEIEEAEMAMSIATCPEFPDLQTKIKLINSLHPEDFLMLNEFQDAYSHGLPNMIPDTCKECGCENTRVRMYFHPAELVPAGGSRDRLRNAVHFGEAPSRPSTD